jgi:hypothetical protein
MVEWKSGKDVACFIGRVSPTISQGAADACLGGCKVASENGVIYEFKPQN